MVRRHYADRGWRHAYREYEDLIRRHVRPGAAVADVGCGRGFPGAGLILECGAAAHGIDPVAEPHRAPPGAALTAGSAYDIPYPAAAFDLVVSRCVLEHLRHPGKAFGEFHRVLKPGGRAIFLTPNRYDYVSLAAMLVPNVLHPALVKWSEGREESDTFRTYYRANTMRRIRRLAGDSGFAVESLAYHNHYPSSLMFSPMLCRLAIAYDQFVRSLSFLRWLQAWLLGVLVK